MSAVRMAKHMCKSKGSVGTEPLFSLAFPGDTAGWVQAVIMVTPAIGYALIYFARFEKYVWLGISSSLITIRLEDVLLVTVLTVILGWAQMVNWIQILLGSKNWRVRASKILSPILLTLIVFQGDAIHTEVVEVGIWYWPVILLFGAQIALFLYVCVQLAKAFPEVHHQGVRAACALLCFMLLFCINTAYYACHFGHYQYVRDDNAIVVGFDAQGRAIEKTIIEVSDERVCILEKGYQLKDISNKDISLMRFGHLMVENAP